MLIEKNINDEIEELKRMKKEDRKLETMKKWLRFEVVLP